MFWGKRTARNKIKSMCAPLTGCVSRQPYYPNEQHQTKRRVTSIYSPAGTLLEQGQALPHQVENSPAMLGAELA